MKSRILFYSSWRICKSKLLFVKASPHDDSIKDSPSRLRDTFQRTQPPHSSVRRKFLFPVTHFASSNSQTLSPDVVLIQSNIRPPIRRARGLFNKIEWMCAFFPAVLSFLLISMERRQPFDVLQGNMQSWGGLFGSNWRNASWMGKESRKPLLLLLRILEWRSLVFVPKNTFCKMHFFVAVFL